MKHFRILFLLTLFFSSFGNICLVDAQKNSVKTALELSKNTKIKYVKPGKKAKIWFEGQKYNVRIDRISPERIFTSDKIFVINKIDKIAIRFKATIITGSIIGTAGLLFTGVGTAMIIKGSQSNDLGGAFAVILGLVIDIIGVPVTAIGSSVFFIGKKYKKSKGWNFKAVQLE